MNFIRRLIERITKIDQSSGWMHGQRILSDKELFALHYTRLRNIVAPPSAEPPLPAETEAIDGATWPPKITPLGWAGLLVYLEQYQVWWYKYGRYIKAEKKDDAPSRTR